MLDILPIIVRLPDGIKDKYDTSFNQEIFERDLRSDRLVMQILPEDYNAANTVNLETKLGYRSSYDHISLNLYKLEATDKDRRSPVKRQALNDLLRAGGNLSLYGITETHSPCSHPRIVIEDYHYLSEPEDYDRGYSLRVGTMQIEALKGSFGRKDNIAVGESYILTLKATSHTSGERMDAVEWNSWSVLEKYNTRKTIDSIWTANTTYTIGQKVGAIAPQGVGKANNYNRGCRMIFTHTHNIKDGSLIVYVPQA